MMGLSLAASTAGGVMQSKAATMEGDAAYKRMMYQAGVAGENKKIALANRDYAYTVGESEALQYGLKARGDAGILRAQQGASGVDIGGDSSTLVREGQRDITKMDTATIRRNAARVAYGHEVKAYQEGEQAKLYKMSAQDAKAAAKIKSRASLISTAGSVSDKWLQMNQVGVGKLGSTGYGASSTRYEG